MRRSQAKLIATTKGGALTRATAETVTQHKIQTDLVSELTVANSRRNVSSSYPENAAETSEMPSKTQLPIDAAGTHISNI